MTVPESAALRLDLSCHRAVGLRDRGEGERVLSPPPTVRFPWPEAMGPFPCAELTPQHRREIPATKNDVDHRILVLMQITSK